MLTYQKLKTIFPALNEKSLGADDYFQVMDSLQVPLFELRLKKRGYSVYDFDERQDYIFLKKGMNRLKYLETLSHEVFHTVVGCTEFEANAFRLVALIPEKDLDGTFLEENPTLYAWKLFRERQKIRFLYGV